MKFILIFLMSVLFQAAFASATPTSIDIDLNLSQCQQAVTSQDQGEVKPWIAADMIGFLQAHSLESPTTFYAKFESKPVSNECAEAYNMTLETWTCDQSKASCTVRCEVRYVLDNGDCWP